MTVKYKTVITKAGAIKLAAATLPDGKKVNLTAMAVGDGGGTLPVPDPNQTKLVKEVWRHALNKISQDRKNKNYVVAELLIPPETGGFWMRELGLYDDTGTLIAVGNMAESYKPALAEGSGRAQTVRMVIMVSDIESVELTIDTTMVMATQDYVDDRLAEHEQSRRHPDATLTAKGFTQLSSATDSASESVAATPKAVKAAYDLAKGKYTAQDATTAQKGIVQLTSATDSTSETLAATPKAVKAANDNANGRVPSGRKVNGRALSTDINITAQDIFNGQAVGIGNAEDLNAYTTPGLYYQPANAQAQTGKNYPETAAGSLEVYKHAGITQIYRLYNSSRAYIRSLYSGTWSAWIKQYDAANKPSAVDVGAIPLAGSTGVTGIVRSSAEQQSSNANSFRIGYGGYGTFWRNDGANLYLMLTNKDDPWGNYNALRPFRVSVSNGEVIISKLNLSDFGYFDARYYTKTQSDAGYMAKTGAYTKTESDGRFQPKGNYTPTGTAYTKAESDGRYQLKGNYALVGASYTKAETDARYGIVNGIRRGGQQIRNPTDTWFDNWESPAGCVVTGIQMNGRSDGRKLGVYFRQMQYLNKQTGAWVNLGD
ncbi:phage tail protein [Enterobacter hormaechei]|uniref:phage tail-collar fiber domain-containing protein n=2 Tax=Enterobacter hormaechei TaxID=158836 RepID=UPI000B102AB1|nr:phage tail protein [Enterobacter hormaechei]